MCEFPPETGCDHVVDFRTGLCQDCGQPVSDEDYDDAAQHWSETRLRGI